MMLGSRQDKRIGLFSHAPCTGPVTALLSRCADCRMKQAFASLGSFLQSSPTMQLSDLVRPGQSITNQRLVCTDPLLCNKLHSYKCSYCQAHPKASKMESACMSLVLLSTAQLNMGSSWHSAVHAAGRVCSVIQFWAH